MESSRSLQRSSSKKYNIFRITDIKVLIGCYINKENHVKKLALQEDLFKIFETGEGKALFDAVENFKYSIEEHRKARGTLKTVTSNLEKLSVDDKSIDIIYANYHITRPENLSDADAAKDLRGRLEEIRQINEVKLKQLNDLQKQKNDRVSIYMAARAAFFKACNKEYKALKDALRQENKEKADLFKQNIPPNEPLPKKKLKSYMNELESSIDSTLSRKSELFRIKCEIDKIKSASYRTSRSSEIFSYLLERQARSIIKAVMAANNTRIQGIIKSDGKDKPGNIIPSLVDFVNAKDDLLNDEYHILYSSTPAFKALLGGNPIMFEQKHEKVLTVVKKLANDSILNKYKFDIELSKSIAVVLSQSLEQLCDVLLAQVKSTGNYTFKAETFHLALSPVFLYTSTSYDSLRFYIDKTWSKK